jgi:hypothetical protein
VFVRHNEEGWMSIQQFIVTPAAGKRLIAKAIVEHPAVQSALESGTVAVIAGTTNGYVAEALLAAIGQGESFSRRRFFRGITLPPGRARTESGRLPDEGEFPGDVIIVNGEWREGETIFDVVDDLKSGDVVLKGANALDLTGRKAAIYIGHPEAGTIGAALQVVVGRRVRLIVPVGVEKRVPGDLTETALKVNAPGSSGPRLLPVPGEVVTELDAVTQLTGATAELVAAGGVGGAEGCVWLGVSGSESERTAASTLLKSVAGEPPF